MDLLIDLDILPHKVKSTSNYLCQLFLASLPKSLLNLTDCSLNYFWFPIY